MDTPSLTSVKVEVAHELISTRDIPALARDVVLYGSSDLAGVLRAHGVGHDEFRALAEHQLFIKTVQEVQEQLSRSPRAGLRLKANEYLENHLKTLSDMASNAHEKGADRIKAIEMLARLADALPKEDKTNAGTGMVVNLNFGPSAKVINHE